MPTGNRGQYLHTWSSVLGGLSVSPSPRSSMMSCVRAELPSIRRAPSPSSPPPSPATDRTPGAAGGAGPAAGAADADAAAARRSAATPAGVMPDAGEASRCAAAVAALRGLPPAAADGGGRPAKPSLPALQSHMEQFAQARVFRGSASRASSTRDLAGRYSNMQRVSTAVDISRFEKAR